MPDPYVTHDELRAALGALASAMKHGDGSGPTAPPSAGGSRIQFGSIVSVDYDPTGGRPLIVGVQLDGDDPGNPRSIPSLVSDVVIGLRCAVQFDPPHQMYVVAVLGSGGGAIHSGGRTVTVAAADSAVADKLSADFICAGVDDHVTITMAFQTLPEAGGRVFLCSGHYKWGVNGTVEVKGHRGSPASDSVELAGAGSSTIIDFDYTALAANPVLKVAPAGWYGYQSIRNLMIRGAEDGQYNISTPSKVTGILVENTANVEITNCWFFGIPETAITVVNAWKTRITNNAFWFCGGRSDFATTYPPSNTKPAVGTFNAAVLLRGNFSVVAHNVFERCHRENVANWDVGAVLNGNTFMDGAYSMGSAYIKDTGIHTAVSGNSATSGGAGYHARSAVSCNVTGNSWGVGGEPLYGASVVIESSDRINITGNYMGAILITDSDWTHVGSNIISGAHIVDIDTGYGSLMLLKAGTVFSTSVIGNKFRYYAVAPNGCIHIYPGVDGTFVAINDFAYSWSNPPPFDTPIRNEGSNTVIGGNRN